MSSRQPKVEGLREDLPPTISPATHPNATRRTICIHTGRRRNLVINLDGTANQFSEHSTNVVELFSRLIKDEYQLVYYDSGIGTYAPPSFRSLSYLKQVVYHAIDTAIAWNFENIVHAAYKWLSENYQPGDRIFLFGFSRGAYQARVIAGMIEKVGLLHKGNERQIPFAYELYSSVMESTQRNGPGKSDSTADKDSEGLSPGEARRLKQEKLCRQFKQSLCHRDVKVHFVGAWDTVSSIGVLRGKSLPETVSGMGHVCVFRHALALDKCRVKFQPEYANGGLGPRTGDDSVGDVKEVWFAGSHSDIGGGSTLNEDLKNFGPALRWMTYEAIRYGLRIEPYEGAWKPPQLTESLKGFWNFLELLPFPSLSYRDENSITWSPHSWAGRTIQPGHLIHQSVLSQEVVRVPATVGLIPGAFPLRGETHDEAEASYRPRAILGSSFPGTTWEDILSSSEMGPLIEQDPFENASHALAALARACLSIELSESDGFNAFDVSLLTLQSFLHDETRLASLIEVPDTGGTLLTALGVAVHYPDAATTRELKETLIRLLSKSRPIPTTARLPSVAQVYQWGRLIQPAYREELAHILQPYASLGYWKPLFSRWHPHVAFQTTNPTRIICNQKVFSYRMTLAWDGSIEEPETLAETRGHSLSISADGKLAAVANKDVINIIDTTTEPPLRSHGIDETATTFLRGISSLCFSDDHQIIATGHDTGWIKLWRREGEIWRVYKELQVSELPICGLIFSKDGSKLAVAPHMGNTQVWILPDYDSFVELEGSSDSSSHAWSPSGDRIFYGTDDGFLHAWDIGQEKPKLVHTFKAHDSAIWGMDIRRDGQVLVTASSDKKIRAWRSGTFDKILELEMDERVHSVNFSADGKQLVSAGTEGTLQIWDLDLGD